MPVLPHTSARAAIAADSRIIESRQLLHTAAQIVSENARTILRRIPSLTARDADSPACKDRFIEGCYIFGGPGPGAIVGIVLGAIAGFILLGWILFIMSNGTQVITTSGLEQDVITTRHRGGSRGGSQRGGSRSQRSSYREEMRRSSPRRDRVIRQERIVRDVPPPRRPQRESSTFRESVVVEETTRTNNERRVAGDDMVEVIEEESSISVPASPRRKKSSRRGSQYR